MASENRLPAAKSNRRPPGAREYNTGVLHPAALVEWEFYETLHQVPHQNILLIGTLTLSSQIVKPRIAAARLYADLLRALHADSLPASALTGKHPGQIFSMDQFSHRR